MTSPTHILFESASGLALFETSNVEEIGARTKAVQQQIEDLNAFGRMVKLVSFSPFKNALDALQSSLDVSEGVLNDHLRSLLQLNLSNSTSKKSILLGVSERGLASSIVGELGIQCDTSDKSLELHRGIRLHAEKLLKGLSEGDLTKAQLGLGHAYSRSKVKFNVNRSDNMIIQAIALVDQLDKDVNTFSMRVREWYGWHFPELVKIVPDNYQYAKLARFIRNKSALTEESLPELAALLDEDETRAKNVLDASRTSMGTDIGEVDMINIEAFADRVVHLADYRKSMQAYLLEKMHLVAPNLSALIGEVIGARLISHAGSLTNLSKYPASTVQILGAEKALFRALKTKGNTPKYGLIYHASAIGRAAAKNKGRMSRFLANKCSIASRIDCFTDTPTMKFGDALRAQVEERLAFYETGAPPSKNAEAMSKVIAAMEAEAGDLMDEDESDGEEEGKKKKKDKKKDKKDKKDKKKRRASEMEVDGESEEEESPKKKEKKEKKEKKKEKKEKVADESESPSKKEKKHKKRKSETT